jgi:osmotically inducible protein OsmC
MPVRTATAAWSGSLKEGSGTFGVQSGAVGGAYTWATRFGDEPGTNPEELLGAAHAACFSMSLSSNLGKAGLTPDAIETTAIVHLEPRETGSVIVKIELETKARIPGLTDEAFQPIAETTKERCPVSRALTGVPIELTATLQE